MNRRSFLAAASLFPLVVLAQQLGKVYRIGFLGARTRSTPQQPDPSYDAWVAGMRDFGYIEGKNLQIEWRFAENKFERLPALAQELVALNPELIVTHALPPSLALQKATSTIPIVFMALVDPVGTKVVSSLAHPGGNLTGTSQMALDISAKRVEILHEAVPGLARIGFLFNPLTPIHKRMLETTAKAVQDFGLKFSVIEASSVEEIERGFERIRRERQVGLIVPDDGFYTGQQERMVDLSLKYRIPLLVPYRETVEMGALVCYGNSAQDSYRQGAKFVDKIFKGAKPSDLPVEQTTKFDYVVNLKTARSLGLKIPQIVLLRADRVIE